MRTLCGLLGMLALLSPFGTTCVASDSSEPGDPGALVRALWCVQRFGTPEALDPRNDERIKGTLAKVLRKDGSLGSASAAGLIDSKTFAKLAGDDGRLEPREMIVALRDVLPPSRTRLNPKVAAHLDTLTTTFDMIDARRFEPSERLVEWMVANHRPGRSLDVTVICTGNSRRSFLGATMGNLAAAYYGLPEIRFHCGGTAPSAFNKRTVRALREIGIAVEPTGREAPRGEPSTANPIYRIHWENAAEAASTTSGLLEFSKRYDDAVNPQKGYAALLVCGEADASCPVVKGASARIAMPYLDPKIYDGGCYEALKYGERRDDIGRVLLSVLMRVRRRLDAGR